MITDCCIRCNNRNTIRAVINKDKKLLEECVHAKNSISHLVDFWSSDVSLSALDYIIKNDEVGLLETFLKPKVPSDSKKKNVDYNAAREILYT